MVRDLSVRVGRESLIISLFFPLGSCLSGWQDFLLNALEQRRKDLSLE